MSSNSSLTRLSNYSIWPIMNTWTQQGFCLKILILTKSLIKTALKKISVITILNILFLKKVNKFWQKKKKWEKNLGSCWIRTSWNTTFHMKMSLIILFTRSWFLLRTTLNMPSTWGSTRLMCQCKLIPSSLRECRVTSYRRSLSMYQPSYLT